MTINALERRLCHAEKAAGPTQQRRDPAIAIAAILAGKRDDVGSQNGLVIGRLRKLALRGTMLPQSPACPSLGDIKLRYNVIDAGAAARGA